MKVAVLGGGMGGLSAAWRLAAQGHEVDVYQRGWRLGGKGASGRNAAADQRIEEHGLHVLMGFYGNAFHFLKAVYDEAHQLPPGPAGAPLPWQAAFTGWDTCVFARRLPTGDWSFFDVDFPPNASAPWDPPAAPDFLAMARQAVHVLGQIAAGLPLGPTFGPLLTALGAGLAAIGTLPGLVRSGLVLALEQVLKPVVRLTTSPAVPLTERQEWLVIGFCFVAGNLLGMLRDDLVRAQPNFDAINHRDYREWLGAHLDRVNCPGWASRQSPILTGLYDLAFSRSTTLAAGVTLNVVLQLGLGYRGHAAWKMTAGMGDIVFAPLYLALAAKPKVRIHFFHRVLGVYPDQAGTRVARVELERQVAPAKAYDPLVDVGGLPCWPHEPKTALLPAAYQQDHAAGRRYDFEHATTPSPYGTPVTLQHGIDFDVVVLAISLGALKTLCQPLLTPGSPLSAMVNGIRTMRTQALQVWLRCPDAALRSPAPVGMVISYCEPFNSWADMSQVLAREQWSPPTAPPALAYFCDALPDGQVSDAGAGAFVDQNADTFLQQDVAPLWPGFAHATHVRARYTRANVDASDRYVLSEAGTIGYRLAPDQSGFVNLALAGDWVRTGLNSGCLEAATLGGLGAADAIDAGTVHP
jgi:uncharacterized protein with NAD-binding domain and iron-sulfur cluster